MGAVEYIISTFKINTSGKPPYKINGSRWNELASLFCALGYKVGAEIGVEQGVYSERLFKMNPGLKLYSIDPWKAYKGYRDHVSQDKLEGFYNDTKNKLSQYDSTIIRKFSEEAAGLFTNEVLDFVYIDGNHDFINVARDICAWVPKVRKGGIVAGHDFKRDKGRDWVCHVKDVVQAYAYAHEINPWFVLTGDKSPSWFWVKE